MTVAARIARATDGFRGGFTGGAAVSINAAALTSIVTLVEIDALVTTPDLVASVRDGQQIGVTVSVQPGDVVATVSDADIVAIVE